jgi:hypothetical protein
MDYTRTTEVKRTCKPHQCFGCLETIPVGSSARYITGNWEGSWSYYYLCQACCAYVDEHGWDDVCEGDGYFHAGDIGKARREKERETS